MENQNIIEALGLQNLPIEAKTQIVQDVSQVLEMRSLERAYQSLSEDQQSELDTILDNGEDEKLISFLQEKVPNMKEIYMEEFTKVKAELAEKLAEYKEQITIELEEELNEE
jgi:succinate dehydrogenase flavin-adding protein (antitoxin of CptAB toxin-antitoxin module)